MQTPQSAPGSARRGAPLAPAVIEALVEVGATETRYYRAGRGTPVLLLSRGPAGCSGTPLFVEISRHHCAIAPEIPGTAHAVDWLRDVIDGLGLERPSLVVDESLALDGLELALGDPERVRDLVVLRSARSGDERRSTRTEATVTPSGHRILLLHGGTVAGGGSLMPESCAELLRFLAVEEPGRNGAAIYRPLT